MVKIGDKPNFGNLVKGLGAGSEFPVIAKGASFRQELHGIYNNMRLTRLNVPELDINLLSETEMAKLRTDWSESTISDLHRFNLSRYNSTILLSIFTILNFGNMLYLGPPGFSKTYIMELLGEQIFRYPRDWIQAGMVYGNTELTQDDVTSYYDLPKLIQGEVDLHKHVFSLLNYRGFDEITRTPAALLSTFFSMFDRGYSVRAGRHVRLAPGPFFATANKKDEGSFPLPIPLFDRFHLMSIAPGLNAENYDSLLSRETRNKTREAFLVKSKFSSTESLDPDAIQKMIDDHKESKEAFKKIQQAQQEIDAISFPPELIQRIKFTLNSLNYCMHLGGETDLNRKSKTSLQDFKKPLSKLCDENQCGLKEIGICRETENMLSVRAQQSIVNMAATFAWWIDLAEPSIVMVRELFPFIASHRLNPAAKGVKPEYENDRIHWTKHLWEKAQNEYDRINGDFDGIIDKYYQLIADLKAGRARSARDIAQIYNALKQVNNVARFPMMIMIEDLAGRKK